MSLPNLVSTLFETGPKDSLAVVDLYSTTDSKVKTSLLDRSGVVLSNIVGAIVSNPILLQTLVGSLFNNKGSLQFNKDDLLRTLTSSSLGSGGRSLSYDVTDSFRNSIGNSLSNVTGNPKLSMGVMSIVGNSIDNLSYGNLSSSQNITSYLGALTGDLAGSQTIDANAEHSILSTFITEAIAIGAAGAFEMILNTYEGKDQYNYIVKRTLRESISQAVYSGNLDIINKLVSKLGGAAILAEMPNIISIILSFYQFPKKLKSKKYRTELAHIVATLTSIDPQWFNYTKRVKTTTAGIDSYSQYNVTNLTPFTYISDNAKTLFMLDDTYKIEVMIASEYTVVDCKESIKTLYPLLLFPK